MTFPITWIAQMKKDAIRHVRGWNGWLRGGYEEGTRRARGGYEEGTRRVRGGYEEEEVGIGGRLK
jgi:hypothetical protein